MKDRSDDPSHHERSTHKKTNEAWLKLEIAQRRIDPTTHHTMSERALYHRSTSRSPPTLAPTKEGNVLFNDALNTFYLRLYGVRHMVKDHSDSERGNPLPPHGLLFSFNSKGSFICTITQSG